MSSFRDPLTARQVARAEAEGARTRAIAARLAAPPPPPPRACCWPFGDPGTNEFRFCGDPITDGRSYCDGHCKIAYRKPVP